MEWEELDCAIAELEAKLTPPADDPGKTAGHGPLFWREMWDLAARIQEGFKESRYPSKTEKDAAWSKFAALRKMASRRQQEEWRIRTGQSRALRDEIMAILDGARPGELTIADRSASDRLKALGLELKRAGDRLTELKEEMLAEQKQECFKALQDVRRAHDSLWSEIRQLRDKARTEQHERAEANLAKNRDRLEKALQARTYFQERVKELHAKIASAWNEEWKTHAGERLTEIENKIIDIEASITRIEGWIAEDKGRAGKGGKRTLKQDGEEAKEA